MRITEINGKRYIIPFSFQEIMKPVSKIDPEFIPKKGEVVNGLDENGDLVSIKKGNGINTYQTLKELFVKGGDYINNRALSEAVQAAGININGAISGGVLYAKNSSPYLGPDESEEGSDKLQFEIRNPVTGELQQITIDEIINTNGEDIPEVPLTDFTYGQTPISVNEVPFIFEKAGQITGIKTANMDNVLIRLNDGPYTAPVYPFSFDDDDRVWFTWNYINLIPTPIANILIFGGHEA